MNTPDRTPIGLDDLEALFPRLAAIDGHQRNAHDDTDTWTAAARHGAWTRTQLAAATVALTCAFTGFRVTPGHMHTQICEHRDLIRARWYCPDPPRHLADDPAAEIAWRRRVAADFTDRALMALLNGRPIDDVPLLTEPEPARVTVAVPVEKIAAALGRRKAITPAETVGVPEPRRAPVDPTRLAAARAELDARRPAHAGEEPAAGDPS